MSRSCHSATFSNATTVFPRMTRARPLKRSFVIGLRLCGIAELPFWPSPKNSSTSRTSVRWRCRNSVAQRSTLDAITASAVINSACRSRCTTWVESVAGFNPSFSQTARSIFGSMCACVPTAPLILPTRIRSRVSVSRSFARPNSSYMSASFKPNVIGSACTPWLRPIIGVILNRRA